VGLGRRDWVWGALYGGNGIILTPGILLGIYQSDVIATRPLHAAVRVDRGVDHPRRN